MHINSVGQINKQRINTGEEKGLRRCFKINKGFSLPEGRLLQSMLKREGKIMSHEKWLALAVISHDGFEKFCA